MTTNPHISQWLTQAKDGDPEAIAHLWKQYFPQLVRLARQKLVGAPRQMADEEDVALSAFKSFCQAAEQGRFPDLNNRDELWALLFQMTVRKVVDHRRREMSEKRGRGKVLNEAPVEDGEFSGNGLDQLLAEENTPELIALMAEACEQRLKVLTPQLQQLALAKLAGDTNGQAAEKLGTTERTVEYGLKVIRKKWTALDRKESDPL